MNDQVLPAAPRQRWPAVIVLFFCAVICGALLLPAIQLQTVSRKRPECQSRLGALASAVSQFEIAKRRYPGMMEPFGETTDGMVKVGTWHVSLLPYIDQEAVYDAWADPSTTKVGKWEVPVLYPEIGLFTCAPSSSYRDKPMKAGYVGSAGLASMDPALPSLPGFSGNPSADSALAQRAENGVFSNQLPPMVLTAESSTPVQVFGAGAERCRSSDIRDGLTSTIVFSENLQAGPWGYVELRNDMTRIQHGLLWRYALSSGTAAPNRPAALATTSTNRINGDGAKAVVGDFHASRPSSSHPQIVNVAFLGGNVSSISERIDYRVYTNLLTPHNKSSDAPDNITVLRDSDYSE